MFYSKLLQWFRGIRTPVQRALDYLSDVLVVSFQDIWSQEVKPLEILTEPAEAMNEMQLMSRKGKMLESAYIRQNIEALDMRSVLKALCIPPGLYWLNFRFPGHNMEVAVKIVD